MSNIIEIDGIQYQDWYLERMGTIPKSVLPQYKEFADLGQMLNIPVYFGEDSLASKKEIRDPAPN